MWMGAPEALAQISHLSRYTHRLSVASAIGLCVCVHYLHFRQQFLAGRSCDGEEISQAPPGLSYKSAVDYTELTATTAWLGETAQLLPVYVT